MRISLKDQFSIEFGKALQKYRDDLASTGVLLPEWESHKQFRTLSSGSQEMGWCELSDESPANYTGGYVWCTDHDMPATHCGTDGDTPICVVNAQAAGCNCCKVNYDEDLRAMLKTKLPREASEAARKILASFGFDDFMIGQIVARLEDAEVI